MKKYQFPIILWLVFETIAVILWLTLDNLFYLFNFTYIGTCLAIGLALYANRFRYARHVIQFAVGLYMLVYLGILSGENMQIEGFCIICSSAFSKLPSFIISLPRSAVPFSSDGAGAATHAGLP